MQVFCPKHRTLDFYLGTHRGEWAYVVGAEPEARCPRSLTQSMRLPWLARTRAEPLLFIAMKSSTSLMYTRMPHHEKGTAMVACRPKWSYTPITRRYLGGGRGRAKGAQSRARKRG